MFVVGKYVCEEFLRWSQTHHGVAVRTEGLGDAI
jgi:hypothetical protein